MSSPTSCSVGCGDPCVDWHEWEGCSHCHAPFHYWRWIDQDQETSKERLGERVYICACLLWTALHDRRLGQRLMSQNPNWSAVCNYYSIVHSLRLFWFVMYGSYPKGHAPLAKGLQAESGAKADWRIEGLRPGNKPLSAAAFQGLLHNELHAPTLSAQVPDIGAMFESARNLRNDSNYESLILAHQYSHGHEGAGVHVPEEMARTSRTMSQASLVVLRYMTGIIACVFEDERRWIGDGSPYCGADLKCLLWGYVHDKIRRANDEQYQSSALLLDWLNGLPEMMQVVTDAENRANNPAHELVACIEYTVFGGKQKLMRDFQQKVTQMERTIERMAPGE